MVRASMKNAVPRRLADVWLWEEWPDRRSTDVGIDLVTRERGTGDYWAIQCKIFNPG